MGDNFKAQKAVATAWFHELRDEIIQKFEALEAVSYTHLRAHETPEHRGFPGGL